MTMTMTTTRIEDEAGLFEPTRPVQDARRRWFRRSVAGVAVAGALLGLATAMMGNANYSDAYVGGQLERQRITFKAADAPTDEERKAPCVVANAGKPLTTGKQAECYANDFIGTHIRGIGRGKTYAELEDVKTGLVARIATAQANSDPDLPKLQKELADLNIQRDTLFKAEMLRGALLTSFGFSSLGEKAGQAATLAYGGAALVGVLSLAGMVYGRRSSKA